ncbi:MAG: hypothetical protein CMG55_07605 [Candidatus Marinimicrobia bacterium]|nr:hypothetical protein [Candidatus Neomarinimicrobiota bacterium]|tara:strand:+ start:406 stop:1557 length:1152 start_codon:yes stop_codon:yes gene_type:complete
MLNKIFKLFIYILNTPVYWISFFIPKNNNIWIFGSWEGLRYSDNSKFLFEYTENNLKSIRCIWLTKSKDVLLRLKKEGFEVYYSYSFKGYIYSAIAGRIIVSSNLHDVNRFVVNKSIKINLWHATNLKKIGFDADKTFSYKNQIPQFSINYLKYLIFPFLKIDYDFVIASSDESAKKMMSAFQLKRKNIIISGLPRTDILKTKNENSFTTIAYFPTFRDNSNFNYFKDFNEKLFDNYFKKKNINFFYKTHFADNNNWDFETKQIKRIKKDDIYEFLTFVDILITDYSSVYFDFCLLNRPIIFSPFDQESYLSNDRELYYNYNDVTPGPKCHNWQEVISEIDLILNGKDKYANKRQVLNQRFNRYQDFKNSKRLASQILSLNNN